MVLRATLINGISSLTAYTQASGEITLDTAKNFDAFVRSQE